jgi:hypothetical protein
MNKFVHFVKQIFFDYLVFRALGVSLLVTLVPSALVHNTGYVDPNLYIGYATNLKWLLESGSYEYHATRLPFIGFINILLSISVEHFGMLYKFFILFWLTLIVLKLCEIIKIQKSISLLLAILISFSPLVISALSWTMPNAFAAVFSCSLLVYALKENTRRLDTFILGFLITTSFLLNAFGSSLIILLTLTIRILGRRSLILFVREMSIIAISIIFTAVSYQVVWNYVLNIRGSFWKPHFDVIFNRELLVSNWVPFSSPISQGVTSYLILGVILVLLLALSKVQGISSLNSPIQALILTYSYAWITYFLQLNFSFNAFWYYYIYLPLFVFVAVISTKLLVSGYSAINWSLQTIVKPKQALMALILILVSMMFLTQFKNPSLMTGYNSSSNEVSSSLLKDEIALSKALAQLPSQSKKTATWYEPDPEGYRGALISSASFHLVRFEGAGENQSTLDRDDYLRRNGVTPSCIVMITSINWEPTFELENFQDMEKISQVTLPSKKVKLSIYCKGGATI